MRRMGRPGLVGTMARTAVVAGTASAVVGSVQHNQQQRYAADDALAQQQAQAAATAAQPVVAVDPYAEIAKLGQLKDQGYLTEAEFNAKKNALLGI